jgi:acetylornithine deacetylase/succinyl-diaminopimelate desuccinylase-like protein
MNLIVLSRKKRRIMAKTSEALDAYLAEHEQEGQEILERLCRQPSVRAQGIGIEEMATLVEGLLRDVGFSTQQLTAEGAPPAVYGELRGRSSYTLLLYNHYDVQPAEPLELWHSPAFAPTVRDGKLYARGASDNKGEIAARLAAIRALRAAHGELPITLRWIIEGEEEVGSPHFEAFASRYASLLQANGCLWEGAGFDAADRPMIGLGTKGLLYVQFDVQAMAADAHSGNAALLPSAAWRLVQALASLRTPEGQVRIPGFYDAVRPLTEAQRAAIADQTDSDAQMKEHYQIQHFNGGLSGVNLRLQAAVTPTSNIAGLLSGYSGEGVKTVLPAKAMAKMDFRLVPDQDPHDILEKLQTYLKAQGYEDIQVTCLGAAEAVVTPMEEPFVEKMTTIAQAYDGKAPAINVINNGTLPLLGSLRRHVGVPGMQAPGNPVYWDSGPHAPNEHIRLSDMTRAVRYNCHMFLSLGE